jgi:hypothetical protein
MPELRLVVSIVSDYPLSLIIYQRSPESQKNNSRTLWSADKFSLACQNFSLACLLVSLSISVVQLTDLSKHMILAAFFVGQSLPAMVP